MVGATRIEPVPRPREGTALPKPAPKTLNLSGTDSTQVDLKGLERTGMDPVSAHQLGGAHPFVKNNEFEYLTHAAVGSF